jgi:hypothetical protein
MRGLLGMVCFTFFILGCSEDRISFSCFEKFNATGQRIRSCNDGQWVHVPSLPVEASKALAFAANTPFPDAAASENPAVFPYIGNPFNGAMVLKVKTDSIAGLRVAIVDEYRQIVHQQTALIPAGGGLVTLTGEDLDRNKPFLCYFGLYDRTLSRFHAGFGNLVRE